MRSVTPASADPNDPAIEAARKALDEGGVVALPTETVYGLVCRSAFRDAVARIFDIKGRPPEKRLPFLLPDASRLTDFVNAPPARARRLARTFWPGPLTLVVGPDSESVAIRVPDHALTRAVLAACGGPAYGTSANLSGDPAATSAEEVLRIFEGRLAPVLVLDGGPCKVGRESSLVRITPEGGAAMLRRGALSHADLLRPATARILVVCSGNTCRSPMAKVLLQKAVADALNIAPAGLATHGIEIDSAGTHAAMRAPASDEAMRAMERRNLSLKDHRSQPVSGLDLTDYDRVYGLTSDHVRTLERYGVHATTLFPDGASVPDPFGGDGTIYDAAAVTLERAASLRAPELARLAFRPDV